MNRRANKTIRQILRIKKYEKMLDEALVIFQKDPDSTRLAKYAAALEAYFVSSRWREDFQADEAGRIPFGIKRGVLSEDALDSFLSDYADARKNSAPSLRGAPRDQ